MTNVKKYNKYQMKGISLFIIILFSCGLSKNNISSKVTYDFIETEDSIFLAATLNKEKRTLSYLLINKSVDTIFFPTLKKTSFPLNKTHDSFTKVDIYTYKGSSSSIYPYSLSFLPPNKTFYDEIEIYDKIILNLKNPQTKRKFKKNIKEYCLRIEYFRPNKRDLFFYRDSILMANNEDIHINSDKIVLRNYTELLDTTYFSKEKRENILKLMKKGKL